MYLIANPCPIVEIKMPDLSVSCWIAVFVWVLISVRAVYAKRHRFQRGTSRLDNASAQYLSASAQASDLRYAFDASTAEVVRRIEDWNTENTTYVLTIYARNSSGEYFVFRSDSERSSIKHLSQELAKVVLR